MAARRLGWASFLVILVFSGVATALQARANGEHAFSLFDQDRGELLPRAEQRDVIWAGTTLGEKFREDPG